MFVFTADEEGVKQFESILGINNKLKDLEARKLNIIAKLCKKKMSLSDLKALIEEYIEGITLQGDMEGLELIAGMGGLERDKLLTVMGILDDFIPLNIYCTVNIRDSMINHTNYGMCGQSYQRLSLQGRGQKEQQIYSRNCAGVYMQNVQKVSIYTKMEGKNV